MADTEKNVWVNTLLEKELADKLDDMVAETRPSTDRAKFIRYLIQKEWEERQHIQRGTDKFRKALRGQPQNRAALR